MKKLVALLFVASVLALGPRPAFADPTAIVISPSAPYGSVTTLSGTAVDAPLPVSPTMQTISDQFMASIVKDMAAVFEHTSHNKDKGLFITNLLQFGRYQSDYVVGIDFGMISQTNSFRKSYGINLRVIPFILNNLPMNPELADFLSHAFITGRYSYDEDERSGVLGYTFGARFGFGGAKSAQ